MKLRILDEDEKELYNVILGSLNVKKVTVKSEKMPEDFRGY